MKLGSKYIDRRKHNVLILALTVTMLILGYTQLGIMADKVNAEFIHPLADVVEVERIVPIKVEVEVVPEGVESIIEAVFGELAGEAKQIAFCESGMNPRAANKTSSARGLFQVLSYTHGVREDWLFDPLVSTLVAKKLYDASGWNPWLASNHCHHLLD